MEFGEDGSLEDVHYTYDKPLYKVSKYNDKDILKCLEILEIMKK